MTMPESDKEILHKACDKYCMFIEFLNTATATRKSTYNESAMNYLNKLESLKLMLDYVDDDIYQKMYLLKEFVLFVLNIYLHYLIDKEMDVERVAKLIENIRKDAYKS